MTRDVEEDPTPCAFNSWARMAALTDYCLGLPDDDDGMVKEEREMMLINTKMFIIPLLYLCANCSHGKF